MGIIDRIRAMLGGSKADEPHDDREAVEKELAIEAVQHDIERAREEPLSGEVDTTGASDGSALR
jgi:hypothetical protein